jgi:galactose mutarotase-like enzyme
MEWDLVESSKPNELAFRMNSSELTREKYPWDFTLVIRYIIEATTLRVEYFVTNPGTEVFPFSMGAHPAFHIE